MVFEYTDQADKNVVSPHKYTALLTYCTTHITIMYKDMKKTCGMYKKEWEKYISGNYICILITQD